MVPGCLSLAANNVFQFIHLFLFYSCTAPVPFCAMATYLASIYGTEKDKYVSSAMLSVSRLMVQTAAT